MKRFLAHQQHFFNEDRGQIAIWESLAAVEVDESAKESRKQMLLTKLLGF